MYKLHHSVLLETLVLISVDWFAWCRNHTRFKEETNNGQMVTRMDE